MCLSGITPPVPPTFRLRFQFATRVLCTPVMLATAVSPPSRAMIDAAGSISSVVAIFAPSSNGVVAIFATDDVATLGYMLCMPRKITAAPKIAPINKWVVDAMNHAGMSGAELARALHARKVINTDDRSVPSKIAKGEREVEFAEALAIAEITNYQPPIPLPDLPEAPVAGRVGAGGSIIDVEQDTGEHVQRVSVLAGKAIAAAEISGDSLGHMFEGWYAILGPRETAIHRGLSGKMCVVLTTEGETLIKVVEYVSDNHVQLISGDGSLHDEAADLVWAARVVGIRPK